MDWNNIKFEYMDEDTTVAWFTIENGIVSIRYPSGINRNRLPLVRISNVTMINVKRLFSHMVFSENRVNKEELLEGLGLKDYDVFKIIEKTHGYMAMKTNWIRFEGEERCYKDNLNEFGITFRSKEEN